MAVVRALRDRLQTDPLERLESAVDDLGLNERRGRGGLLADNLVENVVVCISPERRLAGERLEEHHADGVDVRPVIEGVERFGVLGTHVDGCAPDLTRRRLCRILAGPDHLGEAKVGDVGVVFLVNKHVLGLQITVNDVVFVGVMNPGGDVANRLYVLDEGRPRQLPPVDHGYPIDQLGGQIPLPLDVAGFVDAYDVGVHGKIRAEPRFYEEPLSLLAYLFGVGFRRGVGQFKRHVALEDGIERVVDDPFSAAADDLLDLIFPEPNAFRQRRRLCGRLFLAVRPAVWGIGHRNSRIYILHTSAVMASLRSRQAKDVWPILEEGWARSGCGFTDGVRVRMSKSRYHRHREAGSRTGVWRPPRWPIDGGTAGWIAGEG